MTLGHVIRVRDLDLPPTPKLILFALASRSNDQSESWPSVRRICRDTGLSRRAVQTHLARLITAGIVVRADRGGESNVYRLLLDPNAAKRVAIDSPSTYELLFGAGGRTSCAPCARDARTPAHRMRAPRAAGAPEVQREVEINDQRKPVGASSAVDNVTEPIAWWRSKPAVLRKGEELGLTPRPGETYPVYKDRVYRASLEVSR